MSINDKKGKFRPLSEGLATEETLQAVEAAINTSNSGVKAGKATDAYGYQAVSETAIYKYFFFEDGSGGWYILRKTLATGIMNYAKGTGGYASVYVNATSDPSGSPTFASYDATFEPVGAATILSSDHFSFDANGNLEVSLPKYEDSIYSESLVTLDIAHHRVHDGSYFTYSKRQNIGAGASYDILFTAPPAKTAHLFIKIAGDAKGYWTLFEAPTTSAGTTATPFSRNRVITGTPDSTVITTPTVTDTGTQIDINVFGSGEKSGGESRNEDEFVLNAGTKYLLRINAVNVLDTGIKLNWYEI